MQNLFFSSTCFQPNKPISPSLFLPLQPNPCRPEAPPRPSFSRPSPALPHASLPPTGGSRRSDPSTPPCRAGTHPRVRVEHAPLRALARTPRGPAPAYKRRRLHPLNPSNRSRSLASQTLAPARRRHCWSLELRAAPSLRRAPVDLEPSQSFAPR